jgi:hypothetical protein
MEFTNDYFMIFPKEVEHLYLPQTMASPLQNLLRQCAAHGQPEMNQCTGVLTALPGMLAGHKVMPIRSHAPDTVSNDSSVARDANLPTVLSILAEISH